MDQIAATASIFAWVTITFVGLDFTVCAGEARFAGAGVASLTSVGAGGIVLAWPVVRAVVQILITVESTPSFFAVTLPGLVAGPMYAAGMSCTLLAAPTLPSLMTNALPRSRTVSMGLATAGRTDGIRAVVTRPPKKAVAGAFFITCIVAEGVISRAAISSTGVTMVVLTAHRVVGEMKFTFIPIEDVLRPLLANAECATCGEASDQVVLIFCNFRLGRL